MEFNGEGHSSRQRINPSVSITLFATSIGVLTIQGTSHEPAMIILLRFRVRIPLRGRQMAKDMSIAIVNKLRIEQNVQTCWQKGNSLHNTTPTTPGNHSSVSRISTARDSGILITVVQRSAMAMLTTKS